MSRQTNEEVIREAIQARKVLQFVYKGAVRIVEPHMLAFNAKGNECLSAWFLSGGSASGGGPNWREYLLPEIDSPIILDETFPGPRPGYQSNGGKSFHSIICAL